MATVILATAFLPVSVSLLMGDTCLNHESLVINGHYHLTKFIPCGYSKDVVPPREGNRPLKIEFDLSIHDINSINAVNMDFRMDMFLYMTWNDTRLNVSNLLTQNKSHITFASYAINYIWTPDPYITNSKQAEISSLTEQFASLTLFKNKTIRYTARFFSVIGCQMEFHQYPSDIQVCSVTFESFKYPSDEVSFQWRKWDPVFVNDNLKLLQFSLLEPLRHHVVKARGPAQRVLGKRSQGLVVVLQFQREVSYHLAQTYLPSLLLVSLSWFSFWMGLDAIPGRVTLLVTSLLTLFTVFTGALDQIPPVGYVKAIDVWMGGCMVFIFAAIGEFIVVKVFKESYKQNKVNPSIFRKVLQAPTRLTTTNSPKRMSLPPKLAEVVSSSLPLLKSKNEGLKSNDPSSNRPNLDYSITNRSKNVSPPAFQTSLTDIRLNDTYQGSNESTMVTHTSITDLRSGLTNPGFNESPQVTHTSVTDLRSGLTNPGFNESPLGSHVTDLGPIVKNQDSEVSNVCSGIIERSSSFSHIGNRGKPFGEYSANKRGRFSLTMSKGRNDDGSHLLHVWDAEQGRGSLTPVENGVAGNKIFKNTAPTYLQPKQEKTPQEIEQEFNRARGFTLRWFDYRTGREKLLHEEIDKWSRVAFPLMFLVFMIIYFPILFTRSF